MNSNDEPAFPIGTDVTQNQYTTSCGMTLRDYFAAKLASTMIISGIARTKQEIAAYAYEVADEMLEVRKL